MGAERSAQANILDLIGEVYDTAVDEKLWHELAPSIARTFASTSAAVQVRNTRNGRVDLLASTENFDRLAVETYGTYYAQRDVWVERASRIGNSQVVVSKDLTFRFGLREY